MNDENRPRAVRRPAGRLPLVLVGPLRARGLLAAQMGSESGADAPSRESDVDQRGTAKEPIHPWLVGRFGQRYFVEAAPTADAMDLWPFPGAFIVTPVAPLGDGPSGTNYARSRIAIPAGTSATDAASRSDCWLLRLFERGQHRPAGAGFHRCLSASPTSVAHRVRSEVDLIQSLVKTEHE
jgi:hypothetical protein